MSRAWMPMYWGDYFASTLHLSVEQSGAYLHLIGHYWVNGGLPNDEKQLMAIARMDDEQWRGNCHVLHSFFTIDWRHKRIDKELAKAKSLSDRRALYGLKGAMAKHGKLNGHSWQKPTQSQSHIERGLTEKETEALDRLSKNPQH